MTDVAPPKKRGWFGRAIIVLVVWIGLAAAAYYLLVVLPGGRPVPPPAPEPVRVWTPDAMAREPGAYLESAVAQATELIAMRERMLGEYAGKRREVEARATQVTTELAEAENVVKRLRAAYDRAEDEGRWPMRVAGETFTKERADEVLADRQAFIEARRPLAETVRTAMGRLDANERTLRTERDTLVALREKLALDLERVRLDPKSVSGAELQRVKDQLEAMAKPPANEPGV